MRARDVASALVAKGMEQSPTHHNMFSKTLDGLVTLKTRISHGVREIDDGLISAMAKQCCLRTPEFQDLVDCPLSQADWDTLIRLRCQDGFNPFIRGRH